MARFKKSHDTPTDSGMTDDTIRIAGQVVALANLRVATVRIERDLDLGLLADDPTTEALVADVVAAVGDLDLDLDNPTDDEGNTPANLVESLAADLQARIGAHELAGSIDESGNWKPS